MNLLPESNDRAMFLPRRMFENYLLRPAAIAHVMNSIEGFSDEPITPTKVEQWVREKAKEIIFFSPMAVEIEWQKTINAGEITGFSLW